MSRILSLCTAMVLLLAAPALMAGCPDYLNVTKRFLAGGVAINLCDSYGEQVLLVVNTATNVPSRGSTRVWNSCTPATATVDSW